MESRAWEELRQEGLPVERMQARRFLDLRYLGQSFELTIDHPPPTRRGELCRSIADSFYKAHLWRFGYADRAEPVEVVNRRLKLELEMEKPRLAPEPMELPNPAAARIDQVGVVFRHGPLPTPLYQQENLHASNRVQGPALLLRMDTTIVVPPESGDSVDPFGNLLLEPASAQAQRG